MKVTVFTSNQPRHLALIERLQDVSEQVFAVLECNTVFPGQVPDFFSKSETMFEYFSGVMAAEKHYFGGLNFSSEKAALMAIKSGDLNRLSWEDLHPALNADAFVVFGSSFIKGWLADYLVRRGALNIHMGLSPYYRGSSCNFWALYDGNPAMVGATIHLLTHGLDSGPILRHAVPTLVNESPFMFTMKAVRAAFEAVTETLRNPDWASRPTEVQDHSLELRYTRNSDFTDEVAEDFMSRGIDFTSLKEMLVTSKRPNLVDPVSF